MYKAHAGKHRQSNWTAHNQKIQMRWTTALKPSGKSMTSCTKYRIRERQMAFHFKLDARYADHANNVHKILISLFNKMQKYQS